MFEVIESFIPRKVIGEYATFEEAKTYVNSLGVVLMEDDEGYAGCADAFLSDGRVIAIQPKGFKL